MPLSSMASDVLLYVVSRFPRGVGRTRLMKVLFLVDAMASRSMGDSITGVEWRRWRYGPFSWEVLELLEDLVDEGLLTVDPGPEVRYRAMVDEVSLPLGVREIVDKVVDEYGFLPLDELLGKVYSEYGIENLGMGEKIVLDWTREIYELAEKSGDEKHALAELVGRLYEYYRDSLELMPSDTLLLYSVAASHLAEKDRDRLKRLTEVLVDTLNKVRDYAGNGEKKSLPPELRKKINNLYRELLRTSAEALGGTG